MVRIDPRAVVMDLPSQDVISNDNVTLKANAVLYFRTVRPRISNGSDSICVDTIAQWTEIP